ncbi:Protein of unknown function [Cotesia congregata]|uniref:Uncharacterized protein n=1 Tax=Cotesia congregata TaxID=51543 RepID=A0A8J2H301_COTCN|nr:Protein of unknown function [Cotesia congregata]
MIHDKTFIIWDGTNSTNTTFKILQGLQQGTVNSPTLFSIYFSTLLSSFDLNKGDENKEIEKILETPDQQIYITNHNSVCLPPQATYFIYFDKKGIIQDSNNVPTIYHWGRNVANKRINLTSDMIANNKYHPVYSMALPERDKMDFYSLDERYWWLEDSCHRIKLKLRKLNGWSATW